MNNTCCVCLVITLASMLPGCAAPRLYQWGGYDALLYKTYKSPEKAEEMRRSLETHVAQLEGNKQKIAPGIYAEIGSLYLQAGDRATAAAYYGKEKNAWPESRSLMEALITNIDRKQPSSAPAVEVKP